MDDVDSAILGALQQDARLSNRELAARLGIAPSTCLVRTRMLRERGVITGFHAEVDLGRLGRGVQALVSVQVRPLSRDVIAGFKAFAIAQPEVLSVYVLAGGDDFLVHVAVGDVEGLHAFLMDTLSKRREVVGFRTSVIFEHTRRALVPDLDDADR